jgi:hypothetical protein
MLLIKTPVVQLGQKGDELGLSPAKILKKLRQTAEKIVIGHRFDFEYVPHACHRELGYNLGFR